MVEKLGNFGHAIESILISLASWTQKVNFRLKTFLLGILFISDLFYEEAHFRWLLESMESIQKVHPIEDDILTSLLRVGVAKAVAALGHCEPVCETR